VPNAARQLRAVIEQVRPELIHAMRIPYEGMLAAQAEPAAPLIVSVWGNDFTLHASSTPLMARYTRLTLEQADALHADCRRDIRLGRSWGFAERKPTVVLPGAGGVQPEIFHLPGDGLESKRAYRVINPRGIRAYVRNDSFFQAIPLVLAQQPGAYFICTNMAGEEQARRWVAELDIAASVDLLEMQSRSQMAALFQGARLAVSPSTHDGTPNTLLEAMACGCLPVAGDLESIREWITPDINGLLIDPGDPKALANAILLGLCEDKLLRQAQAMNVRLISERAAYPAVMAEAARFYQQLV
jgi:glycosyltransferase involved in cell wall biosynthesis